MVTPSSREVDFSFEKKKEVDPDQKGGRKGGAGVEVGKGEPYE